MSPAVSRGRVYLSSGSRRYGRRRAEDSVIGVLPSTPHTFFTRSAVRARHLCVRAAQMRAKACSMMSRPSLSRSSPITSGGRKRRTLP